jgi:hypothetical protein
MQFFMLSFTMTIRIEIANESLRAGLPAFAAKVWSFPGDQVFLDWYFGSPKTQIFVAHDDGEWLACIGVFERIYSVNGRRIPCYETYAWASLPMTNRTKGLGIKAMKMAMAEGRPVVALGGSYFTEEFMPRLGFKTVAHAPSLTLPLRGSSVPGSGLKRSLVRAGLDVAGRLLVPSARDDGVRYVPVTCFSDDLLAIDGLPGFHACPDNDFFAWQDRRPDIGNFLPLTFVNRADEPIGWCYTRIAEEDRPGQLIARILETTYFPRSSPRERDAMMRVVVRILAGFDVAAVRVLTTCPDTITALRKLHFWAGRMNPAMVFLNGLEIGEAPPRISSLRADGGILPIPYSLARYRL